MIAGDPKAKKNMVPKIKEEYKGEAYESEDEYADPDQQEEDGFKIRQEEEYDRDHRWKK